MRPKENIITHFIQNRGDNSELASPELMLRTLFPDIDDTSELLIELPSDQYLASAIARAVEDCDAHLLNLNVIAGKSGGRLVALRIDHRNAEAVARSLERYGMRVLDIMNSAGDDADLPSPYDETARRRAQELLRILSI